MNQKPHTPAMVNEILDYLKPQKNQNFLDATFGAGGHSQILADVNDTKIVAFDCDPETYKYAQIIKKQRENQFQFYNEKFDQIEYICKHKLNNIKFDGVIFDLGISSMQIEDQERGFSFKYQNNIDMRMNKKGFTAQEVINTLEQHELEQIFALYAQEKKAALIAKKIVQKRKNEPINNTLQLAQICHQSVYKKNQRINPATKVFQALRIFVNDELNQLVIGLNSAVKILKPNGKIIVISFHSLEDRIVKNFFRYHAQYSNQIIYNSEKPLLEIITKKPLIPKEIEIKNNPRVRSAKMRIAQRTHHDYYENENYPDISMPRLRISEQNIRYLKKIM